MLDTSKLTEKQKIVFVWWLFCSVLAYLLTGGTRIAPLLRLWAVSAEACELTKCFLSGCVSQGQSVQRSRQQAGGTAVFVPQISFGKENKKE